MIPMVELRKASIHLLTSVLCLPLHFKSLPIKREYNAHIILVTLRCKIDCHMLRLSLISPCALNFCNFSDIFGVSQEPVLTYLSLKLRIIDLLINALTVEVDTANTHMLLGMKRQSI